ncbi:type VII secretion target [Nocardia sp. CDC159]|uniref:Type VII secretion target n=1 Tax=Nocardia pulmonis TaxID=2951408 RepID=A0A9X2IX70_9NOCA|nr:MULTISPECIES: type VII secretion target [Nocardia]MCM6775058.1 type VII secretion target [Nocardia pulmonis]MCM6789528.1 type VII secretion target [Nocardia sp. CDC159]
MANDQPSGSGMIVDPAALQTFARNLTSEAQGITGLPSGLGAASEALPGTGWNAACTQAKTSVEAALRRIGDRLTKIAESVEQSGRAIQLTDEQFRDRLTRIGLQR